MLNFSSHWCLPFDYLSENFQLYAKHGDETLKSKKTLQSQKRETSKDDALKTNLKQAKELKRKICYKPVASPIKLIIRKNW